MLEISIIQDEIIDRWSIAWTLRNLQRQVFDIHKVDGWNVLNI